MMPHTRAPPRRRSRDPTRRREPRKATSAKSTASVTQHLRGYLRDAVQIPANVSQTLFEFIRNPDEPASEAANQPAAHKNVSQIPIQSLHAEIPTGKAVCVRHQALLAPEHQRTDRVDQVRGLREVEPQDEDTRINPEDSGDDRERAGLG